MPNHTADITDMMSPTAMGAVKTSHEQPMLESRRVPWASSLRNQIGAAIFTLAAAFAGTVAFTLYEVELRKHDYAILNLAGQLRVFTQSMVGQARHYLEAIGGPTVGSEGASQFARNLNQQVMAFDKIIKAFEDRNLPPELTGSDEPLKCNWDEASINQLKITARFWETYRNKLLEVWGVSGEEIGVTLKITAQHILENDKELQGAATELTKSFQRMMEDKLRMLKMVNQAALAIMALLMIFILVLLHRKILGPLKLTLAGFSRVSQGEMGYQVPITSDNEIGQMTDGFNHLSTRLNALFRLTDRINRGTNLGDTLCFISEEFRSFLPLDWVGILAISPNEPGAVLERIRSTVKDNLQEGEFFADRESRFEILLNAGQPLSITDLADYARQYSQATFAARLAQEGLGSAVYMPLNNTPEGGMILVFASCQAGAYTADHLEWLNNIAGQVTHSVDRTVVMEDLVISAVAGLAKLAESRDPETGDHLVRMSLYSAIIAEQLERDSAYSDQLNADIIRDIYRFAPMHDIGKVGIKDDILLKPGRLTEDERREMEEHPTIGGQVLRRCESQMNAHGHSVFNVGIEIAECHHEKFDGSGYPLKLSGENIPLSARIVAVADVFDALTSKRPYKEAWSIEDALVTLRKDTGTHFDPEIVSAAEQALPRMLDVYERLKHV